MENIGVDFIDESEVLTASDTIHIRKTEFFAPFVCGCKNLGEAFRRIDEGAVMIRTKGAAGTGNIFEAVKHMRLLKNELITYINLDKESRMNFLKSSSVNPDNEPALSLKDPILPVVTFSAGGIATPADASLMMNMGAQGVFVGSGIFKNSDSASTAKAIVEATTNYTDWAFISESSFKIGESLI